MVASRPAIRLPAGHRRLLLHTCCAPCSGEIIEGLRAGGVDLTLYFYNPNIHPRREYLLRKADNVRFAEASGVPLVDADYDAERWFAAARGLEDAPERGARCDMCFADRLAHTAAFARANGFTLISSALGISRWKDMAQINRAGHHAAAAAQVAYWDYNWRKGGGAERMVGVAKREGFYQQQYCGCAFSLRDTNRRRRAAGRPLVRIGQHSYGEPAAP